MPGTLVFSKKKKNTAGGFRVTGHVGSTCFRVLPGLGVLGLALCVQTRVQLDCWVCPPAGQWPLCPPSLARVQGCGGLCAFPSPQHEGGGAGTEGPLYVPPA